MIAATKLSRGERAFTLLELLVALGFITTLVLLEAVRRTIGWPMVVITLVFLLYAKFGYLSPGMLNIYPQSWSRIMADAYLSISGIFGALSGLASSIIFAFIAFGVPGLVIMLVVILIERNLEKIKQVSPELWKQLEEWE